ncbi:MAG: radical SAM protein [Candidatus Omnitrophica bacterium]|nr:radical SAM protein [Candidatus Omnitrophota bacterium]
MRGALVFELNACRNNCVFCGSQRKVSDIPVLEMKRIERLALKHALELKNGGYDELEISGGDPVEYPRIAEFVRLLRGRLGFRSVQLSTHGCDLADPVLVDRLRSAGLTQYRIPFYGVTPKVHDAVTQRHGSFMETLRGIKNIRAQAPSSKIQITSLLMRQNCRQVLRILRLAAEYADEIVFSIPCIPDIKGPMKFALSFDELGSLARELLREAARIKRRVHILDVPFCAVGIFSPGLANKGGPPQLAPSYSVPDIFKTKTHGLPSYRVKRKVFQCGRCRVSGLCDGFYDSYLKIFDVAHFRPL